MLYIKVKSFENPELYKYGTIIKQEQNIDEMFDCEKIPDTAEIREILKDIDHAYYSDEYSFIDRFGFKLRAEELSTGSKAAILVANHPELWIDLTSSDCLYFLSTKTIVSIPKALAQPNSTETPIESSGNAINKSVF